MKKAVMIASVASMIDQFNGDNLKILKELGYDVVVMANFVNGNTTSNERVELFRQELIEDGIEVIHVPIPRKITDFSSIYCSYRQIKNFIMAHNVDLVHCQSPIGGVVARLAAKESHKQGTKVIYTAHGFHFYKGAPVVNWLVFYPMERLLAHITDVLITMNQEDFLRAKKFKSCNAVYIPGVGINTTIIDIQAEARKKIREEFHLKETTRIIVCVAELIKRKNLDVAIKSFALAECENTVLLLCGKGPEEAHLKQVAKKYGVQKRVIFAGYREDIDWVLQSADLFFFPSKQEGLSVALMEAMARGLPVVVSDIRGNVDLVGRQEKEVRIQKDQVELFAKEIRKLMKSDALRKNYGQKNSSRMKMFSREKIHKKMVQIYRSVSI